VPNASREYKPLAPACLPVVNFPGTVTKGAGPETIPLSKTASEGPANAMLDFEVEVEPISV